MIENYLVKKEVTYKTKITIKSLISLGIIILSIALPQVVHLFAGAAGGAKWLPMYLPVLLGGCLLGSVWGLGVAITSPLLSFLITSIAGNPMPMLDRLPFMITELAVFALVSGAFSKVINKNALFAFPAVVIASFCGRGVFLLLSVIFQSVSPFTPAIVWGQIKVGFLAVALQAIIIPAVVIGLKFILNRTDKKA